MITLEQYGLKYGFVPPKLPSSLNEITKLRVRIKMERFNERKTVLKQQLLEEERCERLGCGIITLPIEFKGKGSPYIVRDNSLFIGGIEQSIESWYPKETYAVLLNDETWTFERIGHYRRLYTGELPSTVIEKYIEAKRYFPKEQLAVISKDRRLFDTKVLPPPMSPLLVAFTSDNIQHLLAVWGLEHEIEKRYGGLLEDTP